MQRTPQVVLYLRVPNNFQLFSNNVKISLQPPSNTIDGTQANVCLEYSTQSLSIEDKTRRQFNAHIGQTRSFTATMAVRVRQPWGSVSFTVIVTVRVG